MRNLLLASLFLTATSIAVAQNSYEEGLAAIYSEQFVGRKTASGSKYDKNAMTCNHKTLPFGTKVRITRLDNKKTIVATVNDRGPFVQGRLTELSTKAAESLGMTKHSTAKVKLEVVENVSKEGPGVAMPVEAEVGGSKAVFAVNNQKEIKLDGVPVDGMQNQGLYKIQVLKLKEEGFGVQIATYSSYDGVLKRVAEMQQKFFKNIMVHVTESDTAPQYRIILGPFLDEPTASAYARSIKKKHKIEGYVINLNVFK